MKVKEIPSGFKSYPKDTYFSVRRYTLGELKTISSGELGIKELYEIVLDGVDTNLDKNKITFYDANYLGILRKIETFEKESFNFLVYCEKCKKNVEVSIPVSDIKFYDVEAPSLPVNITLSNEEPLSFSFLTLEKIFYLLDKGYDLNWDNLMASQCISYPFEKSLEKIKNLSVEDTPLLDKVDTLLYHGIMPIQTECKETEYIENPKNKTGISLNDLMKMTPEELDNLAVKYQLAIDENYTTQQKIENFMILLNIADMKNCGQKITINLGNGENIVYPFRRSIRDIENSISFG